MLNPTVRWAGPLLAALAFPLAEFRAVAGQEPLVTDRPDFTESASVVGPGRFQLESGATFTRDAEGDGLTLGEILLRIGAAERLEVRVAANSYAWLGGPDRTREGFEDPALGFKWVVVETERAAAALLAGTTLPIGADDVGAEDWQPEMAIAVARDWGVASLGANLGWGWEKAEQRFHTGLASASIGLPLGERGGAYLETYAVVAEGAGGEEAYADAGITRLLSTDLQLDARVGVGLNDDAADWFIGIGAARRW